MENIHFGKQILSYMNNTVDEQKARTVDPLRLARCYCFLLQETIELNKIFPPHCFCIRSRLRCLLRGLNSKKLSKISICN